MALYIPENEAQDTLASDFVHGTDSSLTLNDASEFPSAGGYIRVYDDSEWALYEYTGISTNDLTGLAQANITGDEESTASHTFSSGATVQLAPIADYLGDIAKIINGTDTWVANQDAGGNIINNMVIDGGDSTA